LAIITLGFSTALGLGLAGGANMHRLVDLDQTATWLHHAGSILQSGFEAARHEIGSRIASFTSRPVSVAQASQEATSAMPSNGDALERAMADLSLRVGEVRAADEASARDLSQGIERLRSSAEQNHRELVAKLAQLAERVERVEHQASMGAAPVVAQPAVQPTPTSLPPPPKSATKSLAKPVAKPVQKSASNATAKAIPKPTPTVAKPDTPSIDAKGIANWTVLDVFDGTAALKGPRGIVEVTVGDALPEIGRVQAIRRSGKRWVVATTKGMITPRLPRTSAEPAPEGPVNLW